MPCSSCWHCMHNCEWPIQLSRRHRPLHTPSIDPENGIINLVNQVFIMTIPSTLQQYILYLNNSWTNLDKVDILSLRNGMGIPSVLIGSYLSLWEIRCEMGKFNRREGTMDHWGTNTVEPTGRNTVTIEDWVRKREIRVTSLSIMEDDNLSFLQNAHLSLFLRGREKEREQGPLSFSLAFSLSLSHLNQTQFADCRTRGELPVSG